MKNSELIETYTVLSQLESAKDLPFKFTYALARLRDRMERVVVFLEKLRVTTVPGQIEYFAERTKTLIALAEKDQDGNPVTKVGPNGNEYVVEDRVQLQEALAELAEKHAKAIDAMKEKEHNFAELLEEEVEDFVPYCFDVAYLPVDTKGNTVLTAEQLRYLIPFIAGDIDAIPDPA